jgi:hypothetical protein
MAALWYRQLLFGGFPLFSPQMSHDPTVLILFHSGARQNFPGARPDLIRIASDEASLLYLPGSLEPGFFYSDLIILYRKNKQINALMVVLERKNLLYR